MVETCLIPRPWQNSVFIIIRLVARVSLRGDFRSAQSWRLLRLGKSRSLLSESGNETMALLMQFWPGYWTQPNSEDQIAPSRPNCSTASCAIAACSTFGSIVFMRAVSIAVYVICSDLVFTSFFCSKLRSTPPFTKQSNVPRPEFDQSLMLCYGTQFATSTRSRVGLKSNP